MAASGGPWRRHVAGGKNPRIRRRAQAVVNRNKALGGLRQPGICEPGRGAGLGHPERFVKIDPPAIGAEQNPRRDTGDGAAGDHSNPVIGENPFEQPADPVIMRRQQRATGDERHVDRIAFQFGQAVLRRKREFDPAGAAADHGKAQPRDLAGARQQRLPARREPVDRLDRDRVLGGAGHVVGARRRADVDRQDIVLDRRMGIAQQCATSLVEPDSFVADQPRAGKSRKPAKIDMALVERIVPGDIARQHARIGRLATPGDQDHPHPRHRPHAEALQDMDMGVPAADEDEMLVYRAGLLHPGDYARVPVATPVVLERAGAGSALRRVADHPFRRGSVAMRRRAIVCS